MAYVDFARPFVLAFSTLPIEDHVSNQPFLHFNSVYSSNPKFLKISHEGKSLLRGLSELVKVLPYFYIPLIISIQIIKSYNF